MRWITQFVAFWYDFIVGDDWVVAAGVVVALALSAVLARSGIQAWWVMLIAVIESTLNSNDPSLVSPSPSRTCQCTV